MRHVSREAETMKTGKIWGSSRSGGRIVSGGYFIPGRTGSEFWTGGFWPSRRPPALSSLSGHRHSEGKYDDEEDRNRERSRADHQRRHARLGEAEGGRRTDLPRHRDRRHHGGLRSPRLVEGGEASASPPFSLPGIRRPKR